MLREVSLYLAAQNHTVSVVARTRTDLEAIAGLAGPGRIVPLPVDYRETESLHQVLRESQQEYGRISLAVCWIHSIAPEAPFVVAEALSSDKLPYRYFHGHCQINSSSDVLSCPAMSAAPELYKRHCFPAEIISHCVWLYFRFCLSYRDVEEIMFERGVQRSYETVRNGCNKFGRDYAKQLKHRRLQPGDKWHLDEVSLTINGKRSYLWRAVDQDGHVLDILVQSKRESCQEVLQEALEGLAVRASREHHR